MTAPPTAILTAARAPADFRRRLIAAVVFPLALLLLASVLLAGQIAWLSATAREVERSERITAQAYQALGLVVDMETGTRGFLLTGDKEFLEPYTAGEDYVDYAMEQLARDLEGRPEEVAHLASARATLTEWRAYAQELITSRANGGDFLELVNKDRGKKRIDSIRGDLAFVLNAQRQRRDESYAATTRATRTVIFAGAVTTLAVALLIAGFTVRQLVGLARSYHATLASLRRQSDAFRESEERFRAIFERAPVAIVQTDLEGNFLRFNQRLCDITGYSKAELEQMKLADLTHADERTAEQTHWRQIIEGPGGVAVSAATIPGASGETNQGNAEHPTLNVERQSKEDRAAAPTSSAEKRLVRKDGSVIYAGVTSALIGAPASRGATVLVTIEDVTARRYFAGPIRRLGARFKHAAEVIGIGTWDFNLATGEAIWSERQEILFGLAPGTFAGTGDAFLAMVHPEDREKVIAAGRRAVEQRVPYRVEYRITRPSDGQIRWMADSGDVIAGGPEKQVTHLIGITVDLTARKHADSAAEGGAVSL